MLCGNIERDTLVLNRDALCLPATRQTSIDISDRFADMRALIDANLGLTAAVLDVLVFSKPGVIELLPALPAKWCSGQVEGICCRGGINVDTAWDNPAGELRVTLGITRDQQVERRVLP